VGVVDENILLDLNYEEDSTATADFNFVITQSDKIIEMQGGAESCPLSWEKFEEVRNMARQGATKLFALYNGSKKNNKWIHEPVEHIPLFSLKNRQQSSL
jgi:ribonuclease PH